MKNPLILASRCASVATAQCRTFNRQMRAAKIGGVLEISREEEGYCVALRVAGLKN